MLTLYDAARCPYCARVRIVLAEKGIPYETVEIDLAQGGMMSWWEKGRDRYYQRTGQLNFSCADCHDANWGKRLGGSVIPQGHATGYPIYRLKLDRVEQLLPGQAPPPQRPGLHQFGEWPLRDLRASIDWTPFFRAWELAGNYPAILDDPVVGESARSVFDDAQAMLERLIAERWVTPRATVGLWRCKREGDDVLVLAGNDWTRLSLLRQQVKKREGRANMCLADFINPEGEDWIGGFAVGIHGLEPHLERFKAENDDYSDILLKALADRLAGAQVSDILSGVEFDHDLRVTLVQLAQQWGDHRRSGNGSTGGAAGHFPGRPAAAKLPHWKLDQSGDGQGISLAALRPLAVDAAVDRRLCHRLAAAGILGDYRRSSVGHGDLGGAARVAASRVDGGLHPQLSGRFNQP